MLRNTILFTAFLSFSLPLFAQNTFPATGNVGIGNSSPQYPLDVYGTVSSSNLLLSNKNPAAGADLTLQATYGTTQFDLVSVHQGWDPKAVYLAGYNASNATASGWTTLATQHVYIGTAAFNNTNYLYVNLMNGGVGIGTTNTNDPNNRLFVETGIRTRKVTVDQATWPDFVFSPGYRLSSLDSLEGYIVANHRLPDMPSADSVAKNGVELGSGEAALLKKVEELTLYMIELNKKNEQLQQEVEALKASRCAPVILSK